MHHQQQSRLLQLPAELQLAIFEDVVQESEPLLLNCGCDSSYDGDEEQWENDQAEWEEGRMGPPEQPALTRTCVMLRNMTLPMFYKMNVFRAHYCYQVDRYMAIDWLDRLGPTNRNFLRDFCFWDMNKYFDEQRPEDMVWLQRSQVFKRMAGTLESVNDENCCLHRVTFGPPVENELEGVEELFALGEEMQS